MELEEAERVGLVEKNLINKEDNQHMHGKIFSTSIYTNNKNIP
jgi:hypothetical protein